MNFLNFGSVNIDHVYQVPHFLQPGETLSANAHARFPGGKGFNQSIALARALALGQSASPPAHRLDSATSDSGTARLFHAGAIGPDGAWLADMLRAEGIDTTHLKVSDEPTGHAVIQVDPSGQNCILIEGGANRRLSADDVEAALKGAGIGPGDVVLLQNETSATADILRLAAATGATVAFNAAPFSPDVLDLPLELVSLFIVNELEGAALCGADPKIGGLALLEKLRDHFPSSDILLTLGANGCLFGDHNDRVNSPTVPARSVRVVDTTAAGDTFIGYFLAARAEGLEPLRALDRATAASAVCVSRAGAAPSIPHREELSVPWDNAALRGTCDKNPVSYRVGEPMVFTIALENAPTDPALWKDHVVHWSRKGDDGVEESGTVPAADLVAAPLVIRTSLACPGFVSVVAVLHGPDGRPVGQPIQPDQWWAPSLSFDGGAGAEIESLRGEPEPEDFDAFWARQTALLATVPVRATRKELASPDPATRLYAVTVDCPGPRPVTGYLMVPVDASPEKPCPVQATFQGYGMHVPVVPVGPYPHDVIRFDVNAHGFEIGREPSYYNDFFQGLFSNGYSYGFDPAQNKDPENAYFRVMALRVLRALEYLRSLPEWNGRDIKVSGGSQGGLQSLWAVGLDHTVTEAIVEVPWCCDLAGINTNRRASEWHIPYVRGIDYFDPVNHAKRIQCPVRIQRAGLGDYTCPPSGIAILYNNLKAPKRIRFVQGSTHGYVPHAPNQEAVLEG